MCNDDFIQKSNKVTLKIFFSKHNSTEMEIPIDPASQTNIIPQLKDTDHQDNSENFKKLVIVYLHNIQNCIMVTEQ